MLAIVGLFLLQFQILPSNSLILVSNAPRRVIKTLKASNGAPWGSWGPPQFCAEGTYAIGYSIKAESNQGSGDDTSLNSIKLECKGLDAVRSGGIITSREGPFGHWYSEVKCPSRNGAPTFLKEFILQVEPDQYSGDDTAANFVKFYCRDFAGLTYPSELSVSPGHGNYGSWGRWSGSCGANSAICGLKTQVEGDQGGGDDTALNNVEFYCCEENSEAGK
ncbi:vitelline membrane outer layer protein 1-like [Ruditapes philippinarum]|uniref:vitelline membrane outer layer protein 1-like n=1 Tax=Ruditapes philippinarum TaxID=129788 RepID=UPI00295BACE8|nr:vitelline membrane outer layer protein 1-like [Ruditapes philippinarum]